MASDIVRRIEAEVGVELASLLAGLPASDLQSLLMDVFRQRARSVDESRVRQRSVAPLFGPSTVNARLLALFDQAAFAAAAGFDALDLSPVNPLGTNQVLGGIDPNNMLLTIRNAEALGDSTPAMAIEAARRRAKPESRAEPARLCASHRCVRLQPVDVPGFTPHFRLFAMATAGRDTGSFEFETRHLYEHVRVYLDLFRSLRRMGFTVGRSLVEISDVSVAEALLGDAAEDARAAVRAHWFGSSEKFLAERGISLPDPVRDPRTELYDLPQMQQLRLCAVKDRTVDALDDNYPEAEFRFTLSRLEGLGYYTGLCMRISLETPDGQRYPVADGGFTDWTARLLQDRKERLFTSGIGSEFVCRMYAGELLSRPGGVSS